MAEYPWPTIERTAGGGYRTLYLSPISRANLTMLEDWPRSDDFRLQAQGLSPEDRAGRLEAHERMMPGFESGVRALMLNDFRLLAWRNYHSHPSLPPTRASSPCHARPMASCLVQ